MIFPASQASVSAIGTDAEVTQARQEKLEERGDIVEVDPLDPFAPIREEMENEHLRSIRKAVKLATIITSDHGPLPQVTTLLTPSNASGGAGALVSGDAVGRKHITVLAPALAPARR